jgi:hypothetical protein
MNMLIKKLALAVVTIATLFLTVGCFLQSLAGAIFFDDLGEFIRASFETDALLAHCNTEILEDPPGEFVSCTYISEGFILTSTVELLKEFGVIGLVLDPVIAQVPDDAYNFTGTVEDMSGSGPQPLVITPADSIMAAPGVPITPEPGMQLVIIDLPDSVASQIGLVPTPLHFDFSFDLPGSTLPSPFEMKAMFTGKVEGNGETFYPPLLPCDTDFADIPAFTVPESPTLSGMIGQLFNAASQGMGNPCDFQTYDFTNLGQTQNIPPVADANGPYEVNAGQAVTLDASNSSDPDGTIVLYEWDLDGDGEFDDASGVNPEATFNTAGTFSIALRVTDDDGAIGTDTAGVNVLAASCPDDVLISNYQTTPASQQFVEITNVGSETLNIGSCSLVTFNVFTETTIGNATVALSGDLGQGGTIRVAFAGTLPTGPGGIGIFDAPPPPDGTPFSTDDEITGMVYLNSNTVFGISHLTTPAHNAIYDCIYGGSGQGPFTRPFAPVENCQ